MKTHLMIKRNWFVCLFTKHKYYMACNSNRKFKDNHTDKNNNFVYGEEVITFLKPFMSFSFEESEWQDTRFDVCQNCTRTKYYKENSK